MREQYFLLTEKVLFSLVDDTSKFSISMILKKFKVKIDYKQICVRINDPGCHCHCFFRRFRYHKII